MPRAALMAQANDWSVLRRPLVLLAGLLWFCLLCGSYGVIFWLPQVIGSLTGFGPLAIGIIGSLPWVGVAVGMYVERASLRSHRRDGTGMSRYRRCCAAALAAGGLATGPGAGGVGCAVARGPGVGQRTGRLLGHPARSC